MRHAAILFLSLGLAGCAGYRSQVIADSPAGVTVQYDELVGSPAAARREADRRCAAYGKRALFLHASPVPGLGWRRLHFACR